MPKANSKPLRARIKYRVPPINLTGATGVSLDSLTIGNALVDVLATVDEGFLVREKIVKGSMNLVEISRSKHLHSLVNSRTEMSGGSAANTAYGLASLGGKQVSLARFLLIVWASLLPKIWQMLV